MKNKSGFTLAEVMVTLGVLGILAAIAIPVVMSMRPSEKRVMFKKAYMTAERAVSELASDETAYPSTTLCTGSGNYSGQISCGFNNNTKPAAYGIPANISSAPQKFCWLFAQKLNTITTVDCVAAKTAAENVANNSPSFTTSDGIQWFYNLGVFTASDTVYSRFVIDVNGEKAPNKMATKDSKQDRFPIDIRFDGKVQIPITETKAVEYLSNPTKND